MEALDALFECCEGVLREEGFACEAGDWRFTLPALHAFLLPRLADGAQADYRRFRQRLLTGDLNTRLGRLGAQVVIAHNLGKVDTSLYRLCFSPGPPGEAIR